jgi:hypothetical protein
MVVKLVLEVNTLESKVMDDNGVHSRIFRAAIPGVDARSLPFAMLPGWEMGIGVPLLENSISSARPKQLRMPIDPRKSTSLGDLANLEGRPCALAARGYTRERFAGLRR